MPFDHFGRVAGIYNRMAEFSPSMALLETLELPQNGLLLDVGGGTGRVGNSLRKMVRDVVIADLSIGMARYAVTKGLMTVCAPAEHLPFSSETFDRIIMVDALHHVFDQQKVISELWRVCPMGGKILIIEPDIHKVAMILVAIFEKILFMRSHFLPADEIASLFPDKNSKITIFSVKSDVWVSCTKLAKM